ncbi:MAG TPA: helix-turn-helix domain-containing protein [Solirubrobacteraceae bacterium]|nr:helix-turn-helix domain-containing protein [Solirubrobacteraceae bacterium]
MESFGTHESSSGDLPAFAPDPRVERLVSLGRAVGHPARARILLACAEAGDQLQRPVTLARELRLPLGVVSYHVRTLAGLGLLVLRSTATVRGAVAHDYAVADGLGPALRALTHHITSGD